MARFNANEIENYGGQGGGGYFGLRNDKDTARVRFMYTSPDDMEGFSVHEIELEGKKRYVNCLRNYNDPMDVCPFCREHKPTAAKLFIPLYNVDEGRTQIWERGKKFYATLSGVFARARGDIVSNIYEIERNGKPGDTQTTYGIYPVERDDTRLTDLPEIQDIVGSVVLDKSAREMEVFLQSGQFPNTNAGGRNNTQQREQREPAREELPRRRSSVAERRTPASVEVLDSEGNEVF